MLTQVLGRPTSKIRGMLTGLRGLSRLLAEKTLGYRKGDTLREILEKSDYLWLAT